MLVDPEGNRWGTLSGGCLEGEVATQALAVIKEGRPRLLPFELADDDLVLGFGTGCDGTVHVLIEPVVPGGSGRKDVVAFVDQCHVSRRPGVLVTVTTASSADDVGTHLLVDESGGMEGDIIEPTIRSRAAATARALLERRVSGAAGRNNRSWHSAVVDFENATTELLLEVVRPPVQLFIFGDGHDVRAVQKQAAALGWHVVVVGQKSAEVLAERFPDASEHVFLMHPADARDRLVLDADSAALVMNHAYLRDRDLLRELLQSDVSYVGMLGPAERTRRMLDELADDGIPVTGEQRARLYGPTGLDIGTETPEEIALAAVAEIQAALHRRTGGFLRDRSGPIHEAREAAT